MIGEKAVDTYRRVRRTYSLPHLAKCAAEWSLRRSTCWLRALPGFVIIGAQRCGTTSLYNYLAGHPNVLRAFRKETHFFSNHFGKGLGWYRAHFPLVCQETYAGTLRRSAVVTGEATPYYIYHPHAPRRAAETVPQAKLIALLRNPVDRAYSHYCHEVSMGIETLPFEEAIGREEERIAAERAKLLREESYCSFNHQNYSYLSRGVYVDQLAQWVKFFGRDQLLVLRSEALDQNPAATLQQVETFIGLPLWVPDEFHRYHRKPYAVMDPHTRERLTVHFISHNERLYEFLGEDLGWEN